MAIFKRVFTAEEFEAFADLPENADKNFEFVEGEIIEKMATNGYCSELAMRIGRFIGNFVDDSDMGHVTGADGGYKISEERYIPDVAYVSKIRQEALDKRGGYNSVPPDLVVEVVSPTDSLKVLKKKITHYLEIGAIVWVFFPERQQVEIHKPGATVQVLNIDDEIDGGAILPGFRLPLRRIFR